MKIVTWNVNSIRAREERLVAWLAANTPDVACLQETKVEDPGFPVEALQAAGYHSVFHGTPKGLTLPDLQRRRDPLARAGHGRRAQVRRRR